MSDIQVHIAVILKELNWFDKVLNARLKLYFEHECEYSSIWEIAPPDLSAVTGYYASFIKHYECTVAERLVLMLSLVPHIQPQLLDVFFVKNATYDKGFTEFGGLKGSSHSGFIPTAETALFILAGNNIKERWEASILFGQEHYFIRHNIIQLCDAAMSEPWLSGSINLSRDYVHWFLTGQGHKPHFSKEFPAKLITTELQWQDLVLPEETRIQVEEIKTWIQYHDVLFYDWGFQKKLKPGYRALFYGPPGTGKTLVACLLGKLCGMDVYRIDLSMIVSKYIGETEKNLEHIFQQAEHKNWILFFDEADALFGKRTGINSSHDRYANQETAYLLQRIEEYNGIVILATNLKTNIDEAFARRFQSLIYFPVPKEQERATLWQQSFSLASTLEERVDLQSLARKHELTGGMILNVVHYSSLMALKRNENIIRLNDLEKGIQKELVKEGRIL
ncbi:MAG TPA: ATP-binding protein [Chitinophagaceae bacterium]